MGDDGEQHIASRCSFIHGFLSSNGTAVLDMKRGKLKLERRPLTEGSTFSWKMRVHRVGWWMAGLAKPLVSRPAHVRKRLEAAQ